MCSYPFLWHVVQQMFSVMCWLFVVLCKPHRKKWILPQESVNASDLWQHMRAFGGELYFLLNNLSSQPITSKKGARLFQRWWGLHLMPGIPASAALPNMDVSLTPFLLAGFCWDPRHLSLHLHFLGGWQREKKMIQNGLALEPKWPGW